ncbi:MAG: FIST N-terminal domain-containing protein [Solirubrobacteraceae bacterium]
MPVVIATGHSASPDLHAGAADAARQARATLAGELCALAIVFVAGEQTDQIGAALDAIEHELDPEQIVGCTTSGLIEGSSEQEDGAGIVVWALAIDDGNVEVLELRTREVDGGLALLGMPTASSASRTSAAIMLADAERMPVEGALRAIESQLPGVPIVGGVASYLPPDGRSLIRGDERIDAAALLLRFEGVEILPCVSQGARPIGPELAVTEGEGGVIRTLAGRSALDALRDTVEGLDDDDRRRIRHGLLLGLVVGPDRAEYGPGDFVVRGLAGADPAAGAVVVGAPVEVGQLARLHVRDPESASAELQEALRLRRMAAGTSRIAGALAFTCNGRGRAMFGRDDHDARAIQAGLGPLPLGGMIAAGEIGPVGGRAFLHGFTATVAVFLA